METDKIQERIDAICDGMIAKAVPQPRIEFSLRSHQDVSVYLTWEKSNGSHDNFKFFNGSVEDALTAAETYVVSLPSPEEARMNAFLSALSEAVELGKKSDIAVEFVNPLVALMKKLSKNALQYRATSHAEALVTKERVGD